MDNQESKKTKIVTLIILIGLIVLIVISYAFYNYFGQNIQLEQQSIIENEEIKSIDVGFTSIEGKDVTLSDFYDKPIVLNFWASWCSPCKQEMPEFDEVYLEYKEDVNFIMLNCTDGSYETIETANEYINSEKFSFPVYLDYIKLNEQITYETAIYTYGIMAMPTTLFIDKDQNITAVYQGMININTLTSEINKII